MEIKDIIAKIQKDKAEDGGIKQIYFVACGGSLGAFYPAKVLVETHAKDVRVGFYNSNEFVHNTPAAFGKNALLVVASHAGNTPETVAAARKGKECGVPVIGFTRAEGSEITQYCDTVLDYAFGDDKDISREKSMEILKVAVETLNAAEGFAHYDAFYDGVSKINGIVAKAKELVDKRARAFAEEYYQDKFIYTMGSGASWGSAYMESICILMEMQWINSGCIHSGEYFHGPFEVTDKDVPFIIQLAEGSTRALDERALTFLKQYGKRFEVVDAKELGLSTIDASVVDYFNHTLFNNVYDVYNHYLSEKRQHPLSVRRYMWKVQY